MHIRDIFVCLQRTTILVKAVLKLCILMGRIHIYSYKKERLYLCSDISPSPHYSDESYFMSLYIDGTYISETFY